MIPRCFGSVRLHFSKLIPTSAATAAQPVLSSVLTGVSAVTAAAFARLGQRFGGFRRIIVGGRLRSGLALANCDAWDRNSRAGGIDDLLLDFRFAPDHHIRCWG